MSVNTAQYMSDEQLIQQALEVLTAALGPIETTRFLTLTRETSIESVAWHRQWQASLDREAFYDQLFGEVKQTDD